MRRVPKSSLMLVASVFAAGMTCDRLLIRETATVHAQDRRSNRSSTPALVIGGETVSVAMTQAVAIAKLSGNYKLIPTTADFSTPTGSVFIMQGDDLVGTISFRDGKLINAERDWGTFYSEGINALWTALDGTLSQQVPLNTWLPVQIRRTEFESPQIGARTIDIRFADRTVRIQKGRSVGPPIKTYYETYSISEVVPFPLF